MSAHIMAVVAIVVAVVAIPMVILWLIESLPTPSLKAVEAPPGRNGGAGSLPEGHSRDAQLAELDHLRHQLELLSQRFAPEKEEPSLPRLASASAEPEALDEWEDRILREIARYRRLLLLTWENPATSPALERLCSLNMVETSRHQATTSYHLTPRGEQFLEGQRATSRG